MFLFKLEMINAREYEYESFNLIDISIEMNLDQIHLKRQIYSFLDVLSDIGGISQVFTASALLIISIFNYKNFETFMASKLFKVIREDLS